MPSRRVRPVLLRRRQTVLIRGAQPVLMRRRQTVLLRRVQPMLIRGAQPMLMRYREERSDVAIHVSLKSWIATAYGLAMAAHSSTASQWRVGAYAALP